MTFGVKFSRVLKDEFLYQLSIETKSFIYADDSNEPGGLSKRCINAVFRNEQTTGK